MPSQTIRADKMTEQNPREPEPMTVFLLTTVGGLHLPYQTMYHRHHCLPGLTFFMDAFDDRYFKDIFFPGRTRKEWH